jgi:hypothetical protein
MAGESNGHGERHEKHPERIAAEVQGAEPPFGSDVHPPVPLERHGQRWTVREEGTPRHDTEY